MDKMEQVDYSLALIEKRKTISEEIVQLQPYVDYLNKPLMYKGQYLAKNPSAARTLMRVISNICFGGSALWLIILTISIAVSSETKNAHDFLVQSGTNKYLIQYVLIVAVFVIAMVLGISVSAMRSSAYKGYLADDKAHRETCSIKLTEYNQKRTSLQQLETTMSNPTVCIFPRMYWDKAGDIAKFIKEGKANTVEEAIVMASVN